MMSADNRRKGLQERSAQIKEEAKRKHMETRIKSLRSFQRYLENLGPEKEAHDSDDSKTRKQRDNEDRIISAKIYRNNNCLSTENEFARIALELKEQQVNMKAKDALTRFFSKQEKVKENLKKKNEDYNWKMQEKRERNEIKRAHIKETKQLFLRKLE